MAGWGGELGFPRFQTSVKDSGHGNRLIGALKSLEQRILPVHARLQTVIIRNLDWWDCVKRYDRGSTVMYLDPPYPGNNCNYPHNMRNFEEHQQMAIKIKKVKSKFILSTYDSPEIRKLYSDLFITPVEFPAGMSGHNGRKNLELIVTNFVPGLRSKDRVNRYSALLLDCSSFSLKENSVKKQDWRSILIDRIRSLFSGFGKSSLYGLNHALAVEAQAEQIFSSYGHESKLG